MLAAILFINRLLSWNLGSLFDVADISVINEEICRSLMFEPSRGGRGGVTFLDIVHLRPLPPSRALSGLDARHLHLHSDCASANFHRRSPYWLSKQTVVKCMDEFKDDDESKSYQLLYLETGLICEHRVRACISLAAVWLWIYSSLDKCVKSILARALHAVAKGKRHFIAFVAEVRQRVHASKPPGRDQTGLRLYALQRCAKQRWAPYSSITRGGVELAIDHAFYDISSPARAAVITGTGTKACSPWRLRLRRNVTQFTLWS